MKDFLKRSILRFFVGFVNVRSNLGIVTKWPLTKLVHCKLIIQEVRCVVYSSDLRRSNKGFLTERIGLVCLVSCASIWARAIIILSARLFVSSVSLSLSCQRSREVTLYLMWIIRVYPVEAKCWNLDLTNGIFLSFTSAGHTCSPGFGAAYVM